MSTVRAFIVASILLVPSTRVTQGCTCDLTRHPPTELLISYDAVLVGDVVRLDLVEDCAVRPDGRTACGYQKEVTVRVWKSWKGVDTAFVKVRTGIGDGDCGFNFAISHRYIIFAKLTEDVGLTVSLCSPTVDESGQGELPAGLGAPIKAFEHAVGHERW